MFKRWSPEEGGAEQLQKELREAQREIRKLWEALRRTQEEVEQLRKELHDAQKRTEDLRKKPPTMHRRTERRDFFVSYTQSDAARAEWIAKILVKHRYTVYLQAWHTPSGGSFITWMDRALAASENFIAVWSKAYDRSGFCIKERDAAFMLQSRGYIDMFLPVRIEDVDIGPLFQPIDRVDLFDVDEAEAERRLIRAIERGQRGR